MKKEDLLKLAEIAGRDLYIDKDFEPPFVTVISKRSKGSFDLWRPHEDLNQAMECLEFWKVLDIDNHVNIKWHGVEAEDEGAYLGHWSVILSRNSSTIHTVNELHSLSIAICKAVLKAQPSKASNATGGV